MNFKNSKIPITDIINKNKFIFKISNTSLSLFFLLFRTLRKLFPYKEGSTVVVSLHRLGDTIFTIPAIREIKKQIGGRIIIFCFRESVDIYKTTFNEVEFCSVNHNEFFFGERLANRSVKAKLKFLKPEKIIDLTGSMISASLIFNIRAKTIAGINRTQFKSVYDHYVPIRVEPKLVDIYLDAISSLVKKVDQFNLSHQKNVSNKRGDILISPHAGWAEKEWKLKYFLELASKLSNDYPVSIISQEHHLSIDIISEIKSSKIKLIQTRSVDELINSIKDCSLFIGNDSGPVNIVNFLGKPSFTIFGATNPDFTASEENYQIFIQKKLGCSALKNEKYCSIGAAVYDCPGNQCMNLLTVEDVYEKVLPLVNEYCEKMSTSN